jgi:hypothetical protein
VRSQVRCIVALTIQAIVVAAVIWLHELTCKRYHCSKIDGFRVGRGTAGAGRMRGRGRGRGARRWPGGCLHARAWKGAGHGEDLFGYFQSIWIGED